MRKAMHIFSVLLITHVSEIVGGITFDVDRRLVTVVRYSNAFLNCSVIGEPRPRITWSVGVQQRNISTGGRFIVKENGLLILNVTKTQGGRYKCRAENITNGDVNTINIILRVYVPPYFRAGLPEEIHGWRNSTKNLRCFARGTPTPTLQWTHNGENISSDNATYKIVSPRNTSNLIILQITITWSNWRWIYGYFNCIATNVVGREEYKIKLIMATRPFFLAGLSETIYGWGNSTQNLTCFARGTPNPTLLWKHHGKNISRDNATYKIISPSNATNFNILQITIPWAYQSWIYGYYRCIATNIVGRRTYKLNLAQARIPGRLRNVIIWDSDPTSVVIQLDLPHDNGGLKEMRFIIRYGGVNLTTLVDRHIHIGQLQPNTSYTFTIYLSNAVGRSQPTTVFHRTVPMHKPDRLHISSNPQGDHPYKYNLRWLNPRTGGSAIKEYIFKYRLVNSDNRRQVGYWITLMKAVPDLYTHMLCYTLENLKKLSSYEVKIMARNGIGTSEPSETFTFSTSADPHTEKQRYAWPASLSSGAVAGVTIISVSLMLIATDGFFYCVNRWCIIKSWRGKMPCWRRQKGTTKKTVRKINAPKIKEKVPGDQSSVNDNILPLTAEQKPSQDQPAEDVNVPIIIDADDTAAQPIQTVTADAHVTAVATQPIITTMADASTSSDSALI